METIASITMNTDGCVAIVVFSIMANEHIQADKHTLGLGLAQWHCLRLAYVNQMKTWT